MKKKKYSLSLPENRRAFLEGMKDGFPIGLGYFAVCFSLGIAARDAGLSPFQGALMSFMCNASAGQYMGITLIAANAAYFEVAIATLIANARYLLMSCALSQKMAPDLSLVHRLIIGFDVTDELFGIHIAKPGYLNPCYAYGAMLLSMPLWAGGAMCGIIAGNILPMRLVSALGVALYGMFLAVIIPPARHSRVVAGVVAVSFALSYLAAKIPLTAALSEGTRTIILTVVIATAAALIFPRKDEGEEAAA